MTKDDLKYGNVVELRNGDRYLFTYYIEYGHEENVFVILTGEGYYYFNSLNFKDNSKNSDLGIVKVYKDYTLKEVLWERKEKPKLTDDEKAILRNIPKEYKWIARDKDGILFVFTGKPIKQDYYWKCKDEDDDEYRVYLFNHLFQSLKWEDEEPYLIEDLLKGDDENE